jgi:hypothetical protein
MAAKQTQEMRDAVAMVLAGVPVNEAAAVCEVWPTSIYAALRKEGKKVPKPQETKPVRHSEEMLEGLRLVEAGVPVRQAAAQAGVWYSSLYAVIANRRRLVEDAENDRRHKVMTRYGRLPRVPSEVKRKK